MRSIAWDALNCRSIVKLIGKCKWGICMQNKKTLFSPLILLLLSSCIALKKDGNFECKTVVNGETNSFIFSYDKAQQSVMLASISNSERGSSVINLAFDTTEVNNQVRWKIPHSYGGYSSYTLDKNTMGLQITEANEKNINRGACKWI